MVATFAKWRELRGKLGLTSDDDVAVLLLTTYIITMFEVLLYSLSLRSSHRSTITSLKWGSHVLFVCNIESFVFT